MAQSQVAEDIGAGAAGFMATDIAVVSAVGPSKKLESKVVDDAAAYEANPDGYDGGWG